MSLVLWGPCDAPACSSPSRRSRTNQCTGLWLKKQEKTLVLLHNPCPHPLLPLPRRCRFQLLARCPLAGPCSARYRRCPALPRVLSCLQQQQQLLRARDFTARPRQEQRMALTSPALPFCLADSFQLFPARVAVYILHSRSPAPSRSPNLKYFSLISIKAGGEGNHPRSRILEELQPAGLSFHHTPSNSQTILLSRAPRTK